MGHFYIPCSQTVGLLHGAYRNDTIPIYQHFILARTLKIAKPYRAYFYRMPQGHARVHRANRSGLFFHIRHDYAIPARTVEYLHPRHKHLRNGGTSPLSRLNQHDPDRLPRE